MSILPNHSTFCLQYEVVLGLGDNNQCFLLNAIDQLLFLKLEKVKLEHFNYLHADGKEKKNHIFNTW